MSTTIEVQVNSPRLTALAALLSPGQRRAMNEAMAIGLQLFTRDYVLQEAQERHYHAERLGAAPTNFLAEAAEAVEQGKVTADAVGGTLSFAHVAFTRAFRDVTIAGPKGQAIPLNAMAYGISPREKWDEWHLFIKSAIATVPKKPRPGSHPPMSRMHAVIFMPRPGESPLPLWVLVSSVTQPQDRSLLPSDEQWEKTARDTAADWIEQRTA